MYCKEEPVYVEKVTKTTTVFDVYGENLSELNIPAGYTADRLMKIGEMSVGTEFLSPYYCVFKLENITESNKNQIRLTLLRKIPTRKRYIFEETGEVRNLKSGEYGRRIVEQDNITIFYSSDREESSYEYSVLTLKTEDIYD